MTLLLPEQPLQLPTLQEISLLLDCTWNSPAGDVTYTVRAYDPRQPERPLVVEGSDRSRWLLSVQAVRHYLKRGIA